MRAEFPQSIDFNQMFVFSVFGHLVILTIVLFLPKPLQEAKVIVPAFIVSLVETSSGNKPDHKLYCCENQRSIALFIGEKKILSLVTCQGAAHRHF